MEYNQREDEASGNQVDNAKDQTYDLCRDIRLVPINVSDEQKLPLFVCVCPWRPKIRYDAYRDQTKHDMVD